MAVRRIATKYGEVFHRERCKSDWGNIVTSNWYRRGALVKKRPVPITLQRPALRAFRNAEARLGKQIRITGSIRSCGLQAELYKRDPKRYAHPDSGVHTHGLAIDVHTSYLNEDVKRKLKHEGFMQSRPDDEPWHFSFGVKA